MCISSTVSVDSDSRHFKVIVVATSSGPLCLWCEPSGPQVSAFLERQASDGFSYAEAGQSRLGRPAGYDVDDNEVCVGEGAADFAAASDALRRWEMFPAPWTRIDTIGTIIAPGETVAMTAHALGFWWVNACRIVYVVDEAAPLRCFGFAYGTLSGHVEQGEEFFSVELRADDSVWYRVRAFSRPRFWPVRLAKPLARRLQRRFVRDSKVAMIAAVAKRRVGGAAS